MSRRFQFSLKWLFVAMLVVAAFFGGMALQQKIDEPRTLFYKVDMQSDGTIGLVPVEESPDRSWP